MKITQVCRTCRRELPKDAFDPAYRKDGRPNGRLLYCRECRDELGTKERAIRSQMSRTTVNDRGCWVYNGGLTPAGYGHASFNGEQDTLHRWSYRWHKGSIPEGADVLHSCNNKACWNPEHLYLGNQSRNTADAYRDGLISKRHGSVSHFAKLTEDQVRKIRRLRAEGVSVLVLCEAFGLSRYAMYAIVNRKTWTHV